MTLSQAMKRAARLCRNIAGEQVVFVPHGRGADEEHCKTAEALGVLAEEIRDLRRDNRKLRAEARARAAQ